MPFYSGGLTRRRPEDPENEELVQASREPVTYEKPVQPVTYETQDYRPGADGVYMSEDDLRKLDGYKSQWRAARAAGDEAGQRAAHDAAEQLRASYGYSGGADGSDYVRTPATKQFTYASAPQYISSYQDQIDKWAQQILNREPFEYDPKSDPRYAAYKKEYAREGRRAAEDVMGQYAAMTGGMPSTAAMTAAAQAGNYYAAQMADKIPELYQLAYDMYLREGDDQLQRLDMLRGLESDSYSRYLNELGQYNTDRGFAYGQFADDRNLRYQQGRDQITDERYADELAYSRDNDAYQRQLAAAQLAAQYGDYSGLRALGIEPDLQTLRKSSSGSSGRSGGSSSGGGGSSANDASEGLDYEGLFAAAKESGNPQSFLGQKANYQKYGFSSSGGLWADYQRWAEAQETAEQEQEELNNLRFENRTEARDWLLHKGVAREYAGRFWDKQDWAQNKKDHPTSAEAQYETYQDYLADYARYLLDAYGT